MNVIGEAIGEICKLVLPISEEFYLGDAESSVAVCTLSSMNLLRDFADSKVLGRIAVAGRLLSENRGIDSIIRYVNKNPQIDTIVLCGLDARGHRPGHSLLALHRNGTDHNNRIVGSTSPDPYLTVSDTEIRHFQNIVLDDMINETEFELILKKCRV